MGAILLEAGLEVFKSPASSSSFDPFREGEVKIDDDDDDDDGIGALLLLLVPELNCSNKRNTSFVSDK
jgi:hypothetical protein